MHAYTFLSCHFDLLHQKIIDLNSNFRWFTKKIIDLNSNLRRVLELIDILTAKNKKFKKFSFGSEEKVNSNFVSLSLFCPLHQTFLSCSPLFNLLFAVIQIQIVLQLLSNKKKKNCSSTITIFATNKVSLQVLRETLQIYYISLY